MATTMKRVARDRLVNDSAIRGFLGVTTTGSASVYPVFMEVTAKPIQIVYSELPGRTDPGMSATNGSITFMVETQATAGANPHTVTENISERINQLFDDQPVTGLGISGTSVYSFLMLREGGTDLSYNAERKTYQRHLIFSYKVINY